jgi:phosphoribosyl-ATP pyrophosphohydrolase
MDQIKVTLKGGVEKTYTKGVTLIEIAGDISRKLSKEAVAAKVDGVIKDIGSKLYDDCQVEILTFDDEEGRKVFWHSTSHVMAQAVKRLFPEVKLAIGPAIDEGFYRSLMQNQEPICCNCSDAEDYINENPTKILNELVEVIDSRFTEKPEGSYIAKLYTGGRERILKKVGEEAAEVVIASMSQNKNETIYETADLLFHLLIALRYDGITMEEVMTELERRRK